MQKRRALGPAFLLFRVGAALAQKDRYFKALLAEGR